MDYKAKLNKQIEMLEKLQEEIITTNNIDKADTAVRIAEEINNLVAHAREILTPDK